jgi:hypothetical protein
VVLGFGGAAKAYAVPQHERLDYRHTVGQARYLADAVLHRQKGLPGRIGADVGRQLFPQGR